jgi:hypothetical protein
MTRVKIARTGYVCAAAIKEGVFVIITRDLTRRAGAQIFKPLLQKILSRFCIADT